MQKVCKHKKRLYPILDTTLSFSVSGWQDSNLRPPAPKAGAITGLRYTPSVSQRSAKVKIILKAHRKMQRSLVGTHRQHNQSTALFTVNSLGFKSADALRILCAGVKDHPFRMQGQDIISPPPLVPRMDVQADGVYILNRRKICSDGQPVYFSLVQSYGYGLVARLAQGKHSPVRIPGGIGTGSRYNCFLHGTNLGKTVTGKRVPRNPFHHAGRPVTAAERFTAQDRKKIGSRER